MFDFLKKMFGGKDELILDVPSAEPEPEKKKEEIIPKPEGRLNQKNPICRHLKRSNQLQLKTRRKINPEKTLLPFGN